jgi:hypothetical protein
MSFILQPWHILLAVLCGFVNKRQQQIIEFQNAQIEALLEKLGGKRVLLTADQRRLLAVKGHALLRYEVAAPGRERVRRPLPRGTESPRIGQPDH